MSSSDSSSSSQDGGGGENRFISWFCSLPGNNLFCQVEEEFIQDSFNLTGISNRAYFDYALDLILDVPLPVREHEISDSMREVIENEAEVVYGLIHSRYIIGPGLEQMFDKFIRGEFGRCPRFACGRYPLLPHGPHAFGESGVLFYCANCEEVYYPRYKRHLNIDGSFFGANFVGLFLMTFWNSIPKRQSMREKSKQKWEPRVFGFKMHQSSEVWCRDRGGRGTL